MKKQGFTLIEVVISIALISLLILSSYRSIATLKKSNEVYENSFNTVEKTTKIYKTLFFDLTQSKDVSLISQKTSDILIDDKNKFDQLNAQTEHSHFGIINPYIAYIVKDKRLYRLESNKKIPYTIDYDFLKYIKFEIVAVDIKRFKVFASENSFLILLNDLIFEVSQ